MNQEFNFIDSELVVRRSPYRRLIREDSAKIFIEQLYDIAVDYGHLLGEYPDVQYEQLGVIYQIHQSVSLLDIELFEDFQKFGFRAVVWGALLIAICPSEKYLSQLENFYSNCHRQNRWICDLAICAIQNKPHEYTEKLAILRENVVGLKKKPIILRQNPGPDSNALHSLEIEHVRLLYRENGLDKAMSYYKTTDAYQYNIEYEEWVRFNRDI